MERDASFRQAACGGQDGPVVDFDAAPAPALVEIPVTNGPISGMAVSADGRRLLVTNYGRDSVSVIDAEDCRVVETVVGVNEPFAIAMGPAPSQADADRAYVSTVSAAYDAIEVIDTATDTVIARHPLALSVTDLVVSPDGKCVYATRDGARGADVVILRTTTGLAEVIDLPIPTGTTTECVRVNSDGSRLYVATNGPGGGRIVVIGMDTRCSGRRKKLPGSSKKSTQAGVRVIDTVQIGLPIRDVALSPDGALAYVASCCPEFGAVIDVVDTAADKITGTCKIAGTCKIGESSGNVTGLTLSGDGVRAYLIGDDGVTVLCTFTHDVIGTIRVGGQPSCAVESPDGKHLYIAGYSGVVTVVPIAETTRRAIESGDTADWGVPELLECEPALA